MRYLALSLSVLAMGFVIMACPGGDGDGNSNGNNNNSPTACELLEAAETAAASAICDASPVPSCYFCTCFADGMALEVTQDASDYPEFSCVPRTCDATTAIGCVNDATDMCAPELLQDASEMCELSSDASSL